MAYTIFLTKAAAKDLTAVPKKTLQHIDNTILSLADNPGPHGSIKLQGTNDLYRIRKGNFRIIYKIEDAALIVTVVRVGNRRDVTGTSNSELELAKRVFDDATIRRKNSCAARK